MEFNLQTERLLLRPLTARDLDAVYTYAGDAENTRYMIYLPHSSIDETRRMLEEAEAEWQCPSPLYFECGMVLSGTVIGAVSLYLEEDDRSCGEIGWVLNRRFQGHGYAAEAAAALCDFALHNLGMRTIVAHCDARNKASARVMERLGMVLANDTGTRYYEKNGETAPELQYILKA